MKGIRFYVLLFSVILLLVSGCNSKTIDLFNGRDFTGWKRVLADDTKDIDEVWSVRNGVIRCTGVPNGYMRTTEEYANYILTLEWRWVDTGSNSGVFLHTQEPDQVWPLCIECQLKSGNAGDFVLIGPGSITVDGKKYTNTERFLGIPKKQESTEKPVGEWNAYKIISRDGEITCYVNDVLQHKGTQAFPSKGKISLQSEGGPIEFRNIRLEVME